MKSKQTVLIAMVLGIALPLSAYAAGDHAGKHADETKSASSAAALTAGEVKKVDKESGKVTIKHGPLQNLSMPAMTMVFRVKDPAMLDQMKEGDKINFTAEKVNGALTVTQAESTK